MRIFHLLLTMMISMILLTGCWDRTEINDIAFVVATGVDKGSKKNKLLTAVQIPLPSSMGGAGSSGGGGGTSGEGPFLVAQGVGGNERQGMEDIQMKLSRNIYLGHRRVHVIGEALAKEGIAESLNATFTHPRSRISTYLLISKGEAVNLLKTQPRMEQYSGEGIREMAKKSINLTVRDAIQDLNRDGKDMVVPYIETAGTLKSDKKGKEVEMDKFAIFKDDKLAFTTTQNEARGILWLFEKMQKKPASFTVSKGDEISIQIFDSRINPKLTIVNGQPQFSLSVRATGILLENEKNLRIEDPRTYRLIIKKMEGHIKNEIETILQHAHSKGIDIFGFGWYLYRNKHQQWEQNWSKDWRSMLPDLKVTIHVDADIQRTMNSGMVEKE